MQTFSGNTRLTACQESALDKLQREGNVFLTGAAGTGKSFLLDHYLADKEATDFPIVASTGAAAVIVGGRTFHSFFGLGILEGGADAAVMRAIRNRRVCNRVQRACCVVIDEVSMLSGETLRAAEMVARRAREKDEPWGGLRIVAVGDFAQLPPVTPDIQRKDWAFAHTVWEESDFQPALLSTVMRTQDTDFLDVLNLVREGIVNERVESFLHNRTYKQTDDCEGTRLYPHRAQAEQYNLKRLESIQKKLYAFPTQYAGSEKYMEAAKRVVPIPDTLLLKEGALIMMRKNDPSGSLQWVNGSLGRILRIEGDGLRIKLLAGRTIEIGKDTFSYLNGDGNEVMAAWNFPITLAWATTIHKAQGASLDRMIVDLHELWEPGQAYVALSRVRSGDGLCIERWSPASIRAEPLVTSFYDSLVEKAKKYTPRPLFFTPPTSSGKSSRLTKAKRMNNTRVLLNEGDDIASIAEHCEVSKSTILTYLEILLKQGHALNLAHVERDIQESDRIRSSYEEHGLERMKPVFDALDGTVSYDDLRLMRIVLVAEQLTAKHAVSHATSKHEDVLYF